MENQHRKIKGYKELDQEQIDLINEIKETGQKLKDLICKVDELNSPIINIGNDDTQPELWRNKGEESLKEGLMFLTRAVAKPGFF